jgi:predicted secreted Zn-dependent protease
MKKQQGLISYTILMIAMIIIVVFNLYKTEKDEIATDVISPELLIEDKDITPPKLKVAEIKPLTKITKNEPVKTKPIKVESWVRPCIPFTDISHNIPEVNLSGRSGYFSEKMEKFYEINAKTEGQIFYQLNNCVPYNKGETAVGVTYTNFNRTFDYNNFGGQICNIKNVAVGVHSTVLYPRWNPVDETSKYLINKWNTFIRNLKMHEEVHVNIGNKYSKKYYDYLKQLADSQTCVDSIAVIDAKQDEIAKEMDDANIEYDRVTDHGRTQGASFDI